MQSSSANKLQPVQLLYQTETGTLVTFAPTAGILGADAPALSSFRLKGVMCEMHLQVIFLKVQLKLKS